MNRLLAAAIVIIGIGASLGWRAPANAQSTPTQSTIHAPRTPGSALSENLVREKLNTWTVGLAGGQLEGAPIRLAAEIGRVVDDGDNLHVLSISPEAQPKMWKICCTEGRGCRDHQYRCIGPVPTACSRHTTAHHLHFELVPIRGAHFRTSQDQVPGGPERQEGEFQYSWHLSRLFGAVDFQQAERRGGRDVHSPSGCARADADSAERHGGGCVRHLQTDRRLPAQALGARVQIPSCCDQRFRLLPTKQSDIGRLPGI